MPSKRKTGKRKKKSYFDFYGFLIKVMALFSTTAILLIMISAIWQFVQNPFLIVGTFIEDKPKTHSQSWAKFGHIFMENKTTHLTPAFIAGLIQTESSGRQWTGTEWTFSLNRGLLKIFAPKTTSFGLAQFTDATFESSKKFCVENTKVESAKPWYMVDGCWLTDLKTRASAKDSIETTSAYLQNFINQHIIKRKINVTKRNAQRFAAIAHLCGLGVAKSFVNSKFYLSNNKRCGSHRLSIYLARVFKNKRIFDSVISDSYRKLTVSVR